MTIAFRSHARNTEKYEVKNETKKQWKWDANNTLEHYAFFHFSFLLLFIDCRSSVFVKKQVKKALPLKENDESKKNPQILVKFNARDDNKNDDCDDTKKNYAMKKWTEPSKTKENKRKRNNQNALAFVVRHLLRTNSCARSKWKTHFHRFRFVFEWNRLKSTSGKPAMNNGLMVSMRRIESKFD